MNPPEPSHSLAASGGTATLVRDASGRISWVSDPFCLLFSLRRSEVLGRDAGELIPRLAQAAEIPEELRRRLGDLDAEDVPRGESDVATVRLGREGVAEVFEHRSWEIDEGPLAGGRVDELVRRPSPRDRMGRILESITDAFFHLDPEARLTYLNPQGRDWVEELGMDPDLLLGRCLWDLPGVGPENEGRQHLEAAMASGTPVHFDRWSDFLGRWVEVRGFPSPDGLAVHVRDITEVKEAEEALQQSQTRFRAVVESLGEGLVISNLDSTVVYMNPRMSELTGYAPEEVVGRRTTDVLVPEEHRALVERELRKRKEGASGRYELPLIRKDGTLIVTEIHAGPFRNAEGEVVGTVGAVTDITERKRAEEALRESEERFRLMVEHAPEAIVLLDPGQVEILQVNENMVRLFGLRRRELLNTFPPDLSPEYQPDGELSREKAARLMGRAMEGENLVFEWTHLRADGSEVPCEVRLSPLPMGDRRVIRGSITDITERKRAEEALRDSEERYRALFENDVAGNYVVSADGIILNCNDAFARIFGFEGAEEAIGTQVVPLLEDPEDRARFLDRVRRERSLDFHEGVARRLDGETVHIIENVRGIFDESGKLVEVRGHAVDVTDRKHLEEQLRQAQKMEAIGKLAGGIAHDFNNLLTAVTGHAELLLTGPAISDAVREDVEKIKSAAERATKLTSQLLAFSRRQVLQPRIVDLNVVVASIHSLLHRLLREGVELRLELGEIGPVRADPNQLEQVIMNLAVNARDAVGNEGTITIRTRPSILEDDEAARIPDAEPGNYVAVEVMDDGEGMSAEVQDRIFEPFFTTKEPGKGTGLGLAMVYGFVRQSGGQVEVESEAGKGTKFSIYIPRYEGEEADSDQDPEDADGDAPSARGSETVLLVEEDPAVRELAHRSLKQAGYTVLVADRAEKGLAHAASWPGPVELLVTGMSLPTVEGPELARRIREVRPDLAVVYMSGRMAKDGGGDGATRENGGDAVVAKPFTPEALARTVRRELDRRAGEGGTSAP